MNDKVINIDKLVNTNRKNEELEKKEEIYKKNLDNIVEGVERFKQRVIDSCIEKLVEIESNKESINLNKEDIEFEDLED